MRNEGELMPKIFMFTFQRASINGSEIPFVPILRINNEMQKKGASSRKYKNFQERIINAKLITWEPWA